MVVTIIDLEIQNILSVENALRTVGADVRVARDAAGVDGAEFLVLPGVGAYGAAMAKVHELGLAAPIRRHALELRRPLVGLCLGMQLLADGSQEYGSHRGLGLIAGEVVQLTEAPPDYRVPSIGWRNVELTGHSPLLPAEFSGRSYYHVHSYHMRCADPKDVAATSRFGSEQIASIIHRGNILATQFHPEKSQDAGLDLLHTVLQSLR